MTTITPRKYGWTPDRPDARDTLYQVSEALKLPKSVDLRPQFTDTPVEDQGTIGSCTANALAGAMEHLNREKREHVDYSRLFLYYNEREMEGTTKSDSGARIRDGIKSLAKTGICLESLWAYDPSILFTKPSDACYANAVQAKAVKYSRCIGIRSVKSSIAEGSPVSFGFSVYESFETDEVRETGQVPMPKTGLFTGERMLGGHAVLAVGYDDDNQTLIVRNSWGSAWGDDGYFYLPYGFVTHPRLSSDYWRIDSANFA